MSSFISLNIASQMTARYRQHRNSILDSQYQNQNVLAICETFEKDHIASLLNQEGCEAIRVYYGMDTNLKTYAILVGVNSNNEDMIVNSNQLVSEEEEGLILDGGVRCPDVCPPESDLNS